MSFTPQQGMNTVLIERNWFEANRTTAHIVNPHTTWKITNNAVEPLTGGSAGFIKLVGGAKLNAVTIDSNWCGDVTAAGAQIEVAGGPFRIVGNLLQTSTGGAAIKAVGVIDRGCSIEDNSIISSTFIDWGAFTHAPLSGSPSMGGYRVLGNEIVGATVASAGTAPAKLFSDLAGCLSFIRPGMLTIDAAAVGGVVAIDASIHREAVFIYLNANVTAMTITNPTYVGQKLTILLRQSTAGTSTFVWPASFHFPGGAGPACSGAFNQTTLTVMWDSASARWVEISRAVNIT
jgi:hypothetical protein